MSTYIQGVTDYVPQVQPFSPDFNFYEGRILRPSQAKYDQNWNKANSIYSTALNSPMLRESNNNARDQFFKDINHQIKKIGEVDLSLQQNVDAASQVFKPLYEDKYIVKDMAYTSQYQKQLAVADQFKNCQTEECKGKYWEEGVLAMQYKVDEFINSSDDESLQMQAPEYVPYVNFTDKAMKAAKESGLFVEYDRRQGGMIVTEKNGRGLVRPLMQFYADKFGNDPELMRMNETKAYILRKQNPDEAIRQYEQILRSQGVDEREVQAQIEQRSAQTNLEQAKGSLNETREHIETSHRKLQTKSRAYEEAKRNGKIIPGSRQDEIMQKLQLGLQESERAVETIRSVSDEALKTSYIDNAGNPIAGERIDRIVAQAMIYEDIAKAANTFAYRDHKISMKTDPYALANYKHQLALQRQNISSARDTKSKVSKLTQSYGSELEKHIKSQREKAVEKGIEYNENQQYKDIQSFINDKKAILQIAPDDASAEVLENMNARLNVLKEIDEDQAEGNTVRDYDKWEFRKDVTVQIGFKTFDELLQGETPEKAGSILNKFLDSKILKPIHDANRIKNEEEIKVVTEGLSHLLNVASTGQSDATDAAKAVLSSMGISEEDYDSVTPDKFVINNSEKIDTYINLMSGKHYNIKPEDETSGLQDDYSDLSSSEDSWKRDIIKSMGPYMQADAARMFRKKHVNPEYNISNEFREHAELVAMYPDELSGISPERLMTYENAKIKSEIGKNLRNKISKDLNKGYQTVVSPIKGDEDKSSMRNKSARMGIWNDKTLNFATTPEEVFRNTVSKLDKPLNLKVANIFDIEGTTSVSEYNLSGDDLKKMLKHNITYDERNPKTLNVTNISDFLFEGDSLNDVTQIVKTDKSFIIRMRQGHAVEIPESNVRIKGAFVNRFLPNEDQMTSARREVTSNMSKQSSDLMNKESLLPSSAVDYVNKTLEYETLLNSKSESYFQIANKITSLNDKYTLSTYAENEKQVELSDDQKLIQTMLNDINNYGEYDKLKQIPKVKIQVTPSQEGDNTNITLGFNNIEEYLVDTGNIKEDDGKYESITDLGARYVETKENNIPFSINYTVPHNNDELLNAHAVKSSDLLLSLDQGEEYEFDPDMNRLGVKIKVKRQNNNVVVTPSVKAYDQITHTWKMYDTKPSTFPLSRLKNWDREYKSLIEAHALEYQKRRQYENDIQSIMMQYDISYEEAQDAYNTYLTQQ